MTVVGGQFTTIVDGDGHVTAAVQGHFMTSSKSFYDTNRDNFMTVQFQFMTAVQWMICIFFFIF